MMTLSELRQSIPKSCFMISSAKSWFTLVRILVSLALCLFIETKINVSFDWQLIPLIIVWFIHGQVLVGLFVLGHECGHQLFSKHRLTNIIVGHLCFSPLGNGLMSWSATHNQHHANTQLRGQEVDWSKWLLTKDEFKATSWRTHFATRLGYYLPFGVLFWVWLNAVGRGLQKSSLRVRLSNLVMWLTMLGLYSALWIFLGPWEMLKYHAVPATIAMYSGYFLLTIQHANEETKWFEAESWTPMRGQVEATFDVRFPRFFEWLWLDINIHIPHHVAPAVPWYHLRAARVALRPVLGDLYQERFFGMREIRWMLKTPNIMYDAIAKTYRLSERRPDEETA